MITKEDLSEKFKQSLEEMKADMEALLNQIEEESKKQAKKDQDKIERLKRDIESWKKKYTELDDEYTAFRVQMKQEQEKMNTEVFTIPGLGNIYKATPEAIAKKINEILDENERLVDSHNDMVGKFKEMQNQYRLMYANYERFRPLYEETIEENKRLKEALLKKSPFTEKDIQAFNQKMNEPVRVETKVKLVLVDNRPNVQRTINEVCEMNDNLVAENEGFRLEVERLRSEVERLKNAESEAFTAEQLLDEIEEKNRKLQDEMNNLQLKYQNYRPSTTVSADGFNIPSSLRDLYDDEIKCFVLEAIQAKTTQYTVGSRSRFIGTELMKANPVDASKKASIKDFLKTMFLNWNGVKKIPVDSLKKLDSFGMVIEKGSKHSLIRFKADERFKSTLSETPSDFREGMNQYSDLLKQLF